jgi:NAD(P)-dependent dehydrogenase (short-subunit alcohol dehydrogenase family)
MEVCIISFSEKVVLITGAAGGIGKETASAFAKEGARLALVDLNLTALQSTAADLRLDEGTYITIAADVSKEEDVQNYVEMTKNAFAKIDVFFNNAGIEGKVMPITEYPSDVFEAVLDVNVKGVFYGLKHVLRVMKDQKSGVVINTSSVSGLKGSPNMSAYITSKHAVIGLTKAAAVEVGRNGIRINAICPSPVNTRMMRSLESGFNPENTDAAKESLAKKIPLGRYGESNEIAELVLFLASEKAKFLTGSIYSIDGGMSAI